MISDRSGNGRRSRLPSVPRAAIGFLLTLFANRTLYGWDPRAWWAIVLELFRRSNGNRQDTLPVGKQKEA